MKKYDKELNELYDFEKQFTLPEARELPNFKELKKRFNDLEIKQGFGFLTTRETKEIKKLREKLFRTDGYVEIINMADFL